MGDMGKLAYGDYFSSSVTIHNLSTIVFHLGFYDSFSSYLTVQPPTREHKLKEKAVTDQFHRTFDMAPSVYYNLQHTGQLAAQGPSTSLIMALSLISQY